jgi:hypothetical protein
MIRKPAALTAFVLLCLTLTGCYGATCRDDYGLVPGTMDYALCVQMQQAMAVSALNNLSYSMATMSRPAY